jgi:hypothetical protein
MRRTAIPILAITALVLPGAAGAQELQGRMQCEVLAAVSARPLDQRVTVTIQDGQFRYQRAILNAQGQHMGGYETGSGRIGADGAVTVNGSGASGNITFTTRLAGRVAPNGASRLTGAQTWMLRTGAVTRACTLTVAGR